MSRALRRFGLLIKHGNRIEMIGLCYDFDTEVHRMNHGSCRYAKVYRDLSFDRARHILDCEELGITFFF